MANNDKPRQSKLQRRLNLSAKDKRFAKTGPDDLVSPHVYVMHKDRQRVRAISAMADVSAEMAYGYLLDLVLRKFDDEVLIKALHAYERGEANLIPNTQEV